MYILCTDISIHINSIRYNVALPPRQSNDQDNSESSLDLAKMATSTSNPVMPSLNYRYFVVGRNISQYNASLMNLEGIITPLNNLKGYTSIY